MSAAAGGAGRRPRGAPDPAAPARILPGGEPYNVAAAQRGGAIEAVMKFQAENSEAGYVVSAHGPGFVEVNQVRYLQGICMGADTAPEPWGVEGFASLTADDFARLAGLRPEVVIIGTGGTQRFAHPSLLRALIEQGIGFEVMSTAAACRTYNILVGEGRRAVAALLVDPAGPA